MSCKKWLRLLIATLTINIAVSTAFAAAGSEGDSINAARGNGRIFALIIGINEYWHLPYLRASANNARLIADCLQASKQGANITILTDKNAVKTKIVEAISRIGHQMAPEDTLIIYYSGHGGRATLTMQAKAGLPAASRFPGSNVFDEALMAADSTYTDRQITSSELAQLFKVIPSTKIVLIIDASYDQSILPMVAPNFESPNSIMRPRRTVRELNMFGYNVLAAGDWHELARSDRFDGKEYGVFTYFFAQGIKSQAADTNKNGQFTIIEIFDYARAKTVQYIGVQHPQLYRGRDNNLALF